MESTDVLGNLTGRNRGQPLSGSDATSDDDHQQKDNMNNINRTDDNGYTIISEDEAIERFEDMLDECFPLVQFGSLSYSPSEVLKRVDPTAYRCEFLNWLDSEELTIDED